MAEIIWSDYAKESLKETLIFLEEQWGHEIKDYVINLIDHRLAQVVKNPNLAPPLGNTIFRKLLIHRNLTLYYTTNKEAIKVVLVWDNRQDSDELETLLLRA